MIKSQSDDELQISRIVQVQPNSQIKKEKQSFVRHLTFQVLNTLCT